MQRAVARFPVFSTVESRAFTFPMRLAGDGNRRHFFELSKRSRAASCPAKVLDTSIPAVTVRFFAIMTVTVRLYF